MRVVDTSAWIEIAIRSDLGVRLLQEVPPAPDCIVPTIVQLELAKWLGREVNPDAMYETLAFLNECRIEILDTEIALLAAEFCKVAKLSTADAVIYATATHFGADLLTCDAHFKTLRHVVYMPKTSD